MIKVSAGQGVPMGMPQLETVSDSRLHKQEPTQPAAVSKRELAAARERRIRRNQAHNQKSSVFSTTIVEDPNLLYGFRQELEALATLASEPNVFYEPWMLLPSLKAFGQDRSFLFVLVFMNPPGADSSLCGFFPLEIVNGVGGLPIRSCRLWNFLHFRWCVPLVRAGYEVECLKAFFDWAQSKANPRSLIEFRCLPAWGKLSQALIDIINREGLPHYIADLHTRALLLKANSAEACIRAALSGSKIKELNRLQRRLGERGDLTYERLTRAEDVSEWIEGFLDLEARGWKGRAGTALASSSEQGRFFEEIVRSAFDRGQLMMLRASVGARAIAYKCNFVSRAGAFAFKIAYDETFSAYSPGVQLELENIRQFHSMGEVNWMDSCADSDHFMANQLWAARRTIQTTLIAHHGGVGAFCLSAMPLLKWVRRTLKSSASRMISRGKK